MKIAISGKMRSGKSEVAEYLRYKYGFKEVSFASEIKRIALDAFNCSYDDVFIKKDSNTRKFLQLLGQAGRALNENYWVNETLKYIGKDEHVIISDLRFKNEFINLKLEGFTLIRIDRDRELRNIHGLSNEDDVSETDLDDMNNFDYYIKNNGTLDELRNKIDDIIQLIIEEEEIKIKK